MFGCFSVLLIKLSCCCAFVGCCCRLLFLGVMSLLLSFVVVVVVLVFVLNSFYFVPFVFCVGYLCVVVGFRFALDMSV